MAQIKPYAPEEWGPNMGRGLESKESVSEMAGSAARGARHAARQNQDVGVEGRGPLLLSGYKEGRPYYLYADGTAPLPSKAAARMVVLDGQGVARHAGAPRASLTAVQFGEREGAPSQSDRGCSTGSPVASQEAAGLSAGATGGLSPGLRGAAHGMRHGGQDGTVAGEENRWAEERRRMRASVAAAIAQATVRCRAASRICTPVGEPCKVGSPPGTRAARRGGLAGDGSVASRLQLAEAAAAIERLQQVVEAQQSRIEAIEVAAGARTGERHEAPRPLRSLRTHGSSARSLEAEFDTAVAVLPQSDADLGDLDTQAEQLWREVAAAQTRFAAAQTAAVVDEETGAVENPDCSATEKPDCSDMRCSVCVGAEALKVETAPEATAGDRAVGVATAAAEEVASAQVVGSPPVPGAEPAAAEAVVERSRDGDADGMEARAEVEAIAAAEAAPEPKEEYWDEYLEQRRQRINRQYILSRFSRREIAEGEYAAAELQRGDFAGEAAERAAMNSREKKVHAAMEMAREVAATDVFGGFPFDLGGFWQDFQLGVSQRGSTELEERWWAARVALLRG